MPGNDGSQSPWDDSPRPTPYGTPPYQRRRQFPGRLIAPAALLLTAIAAITVVVFPRSNAVRLSPAGDPGAGESQHGLSVTAGTGNGGTASPAAQPPAITKAEAERVLSAYWRVNNEANEQRSGSLLEIVEGGTSYTMDIGAYRFEQAAGPSASAYVPFEPVDAAYYIPRLAAGDYPRWFAAAVTYAGLASPQHPTGSGYLLFRQASAGAAWKNVLEPYVLPGSGPAPHIATDAGGYATAVSPAGDAAGLSIAPGQIGPVTAASLDGSSTAIKAPGNLTDLHDEAFWQSRLPAGSTDTDKHRPGPGLVFGLRTTDGGALLFYPLAAQLSLTPPPGETFELTIPGYYAPSQALTSAVVGYIEQFAAYDPPQGHAGPHIAADASSIASRD
ncbi:MAG: hypothetical protein M3Y33_10675 [Actinomycetota bacterium]|nr:hypothetical protein [Actinomycetota bacterium]